MNQTVLISLQDDPGKAGGKRASGAFEAQKAMARGHGKNDARLRVRKSFCRSSHIKVCAIFAACAARHMPQNDPPDRFARAAGRHVGR
jgi:hypothetical protein